jgi:hypothetical protein
MLSLPSRLKSVSCEAPVIFLSAQHEQHEWERAMFGDGTSPPKAIRALHWELVEDRENKPGLVTSSPAS